MSNSAKNIRGHVTTDLFFEYGLGSIRTEAAPRKTIKCYKLMRLVDGKLYPLYIDNSAPIELGTWYNAESPDFEFLKTLPAGYHLIEGKNTLVKSQTKKPNLEDVREATANGQRWMKIIVTKLPQRRYKGESRAYYNVGINQETEKSDSGEVIGIEDKVKDIYAMRAGWHAGSLPTMRQVFCKPYGEKRTRDNYVFVECEISADVDYNAEAQQNPEKDLPDKLPTNGYYLKATNADKEAAQADRVGWYVAGAIKLNRIISDSEAHAIIDRFNAEHPDDKPVKYQWPRESGCMFNADTMKLEGLNGINDNNPKTGEKNMQNIVFSEPVNDWQPTEVENILFSKKLKIYRIADFEQKRDIYERTYYALKTSDDKKLIKELCYCREYGVCLYSDFFVSPLEMFITLSEDKSRLENLIVEDKVIDAYLDKENRLFAAYLQPKVGKVDADKIIWDCVCDDNIRPVLCGVFHKDGYKVATDAHVLVKLKQKYAAGCEDKIILKNGQVVDGQYPNYNSIIATDGKIYTPDIERLRMFAKSVTNLVKWRKGDISTTQIRIVYDNDNKQVFKADFLPIFLDACTLLKDCKFIYSDTIKPITAKGSDGSIALLCPMCETDEEMPTFYFDKNAKPQKNVSFDINNIETSFEKYREAAGKKVAALADCVILLVPYYDRHSKELDNFLNVCCRVISRRVSANLNKAVAGLGGVPKKRHSKPVQYSLFGTDEKPKTETDEEYKERLRAFLTEHAEPFRVVPCTWNSFLNEFGTDGECQSPIGTIILKYDDLEKMQKKFRDKYFGLIKPTLQRPVFIIKHRERQLFVKSFIDKKSNTVYFFSVVKSENDEFELSSNHTKKFESLINKIREGEITADPHHFTTALNGPDRPLPNYLYLSVGFPFMCKKNKKRMEATTVDTHQLTTTLNGPDRPLSNCCVPSVGLSPEDKNTKKSIPQTKSVNNTGLGFVPFTQKSDVKTERLKGDLGKFIGAFDRNQFSIVLRGDKGAGKSRLLYQLINAFAAKGLKVGFYSLEMGTQSSVTQRYKAEYLKRNNLPRIDINTDSPDYVQLSAACKQYDVVAIDSWTKLKDVRQNDFDRLQKENPNTVIVAVFQSTTGKVTRGGNMPEYDGGIVIHVKTGGIAECEKNRYAATDKEYSVFEQKLIEE